MSHRSDTPFQLKVVGVTLAVLIAWVVLLLAAPWPQYWRLIATEQTPMTWLQSVLLILTAFVAALLAWLASLNSDRWTSKRWTLVSGGFLFLAADERFALHERVRDRILAPRDITLLPWMGPGDFIVLLYLVAGLIGLRWILVLYKESGLARSTVLVGVVLMIVATAMDSFDPERMSLAVERFEQTAEEVVELLGFAALLLGTVFVLISNLRRLAPNETGEATNA